MKRVTIKTYDQFLNDIKLVIEYYDIFSHLHPGKTSKDVEQARERLECALDCMEIHHETYQ